MPIYEVSGRSTLTTATAQAALVALRAVTRSIRVWEIHLFYVTAPTTSGGLGLIRSTALGTGTLTSVNAVPRSTATGIAAATGILNTAWATVAPTNGGAGSVFRRLHTSPTIGNGVIWSFDREPLEIAGSAGATSEICICNTVAVAPGTFDITFIFEE